MCACYQEHYLGRERAVHALGTGRRVLWVLPSAGTPCGLAYCPAAAEWHEAGGDLQELKSDIV